MVVSPLTPEGRSPAALALRHVRNRQSFEFLIAAVAVSFYNRILKRWKKKNSDIFLASVGIITGEVLNMMETAIRKAEDEMVWLGAIPDMWIAARERQLPSDQSIGVPMHQFFIGMFENFILQMRKSILQQRQRERLPIDQFIEAPMHLLFIGMTERGNTDNATVDGDLPVPRLEWEGNNEDFIRQARRNYIPQQREGGQN